MRFFFLSGIYKPSRQTENFWYFSSYKHGLISEHKCKEALKLGSFSLMCKTKTLFILKMSNAELYFSIMYNETT